MRGQQIQVIDVARALICELQIDAIDFRILQSRQDRLVVANSLWQQCR